MVVKCNIKGLHVTCKFNITADGVIKVSELGGVKTVSRVMWVSIGFYVTAKLSSISWVMASRMTGPLLCMTIDKPQTIWNNVERYGSVQRN